MLNPNIEIKKWFYTNLTSASGLTVYDGIAPEGAGDEYIVMSGRTSSQEQGKSGYTQFLPVGSKTIPSNTTASYIYVSGSTNDLYFTQYPLELYIF